MKHFMKRHRLQSLSILSDHFNVVENCTRAATAAWMGLRHSPEPDSRKKESHLSWSLRKILQLVTTHFLVCLVYFTRGGVTVVHSSSIHVNTGHYILPILTIMVLTVTPMFQCYWLQQQQLTAPTQPPCSALNLVLFVRLLLWDQFIQQSLCSAGTSSSQHQSPYLCFCVCLCL